MRLRPELSDAERERALELIQEAVYDTTPRKACEDAPCFALEGGSYVVCGAPAVIDGVADVLQTALLVLFAAAMVLMAATLASSSARGCACCRWRSRWPRPRSPSASPVSSAAR